MWGGDFGIANRLGPGVLEYSSEMGVILENFAHHYGRNGGFLGHMSIQNVFCVPFEDTDSRYDFDYHWGNVGQYLGRN